MRLAMRGLTTRGRCLLAAGFAAALCSLLLGEKDLLRVAVFLVALPLLSVATLARTRFKLACSRNIVPDRVAVGQTAEVELVLHNVSLLPTSLLLLEDELPYTLGGRPRFTVERVSAGTHRTVRYSVRSDVRGRFPVGPLRLRLTDAFGLVELTRSFSARDRLTVVPAVLPLPAAHLPGAWLAGSGATARSVSARGEEDAATREYRHGDDLRKVHWRSTARAGKMMVRREERPRQARATLLLDSRASAHCGDAPNSSFEWSVTAVASIGVHLLRNGFVLNLITDNTTPIAGVASERVLLDALADARLTRSRGLGALSPVARNIAREGTLIAVVGGISEDEAGRLANVRTGLSSSIAICVDPNSWLAMDSSGRERSAKAAAQRDKAFATQGWRVLTADRRTPIAQVWSKVGRRGDAAPGSPSSYATLTAARRR
jgi:uncharacterized protein (DUF58 family)